MSAPRVIEAKVFLPVCDFALSTRFFSGPWFRTVPDYRRIRVLAIWNSGLPTAERLHRCTGKSPHVAPACQ